MNKELAAYIIKYFSELMTENESLALWHYRCTYQASVSPEMRQFLMEKGWISTEPEILEFLKDGYDVFETNVAKRIMQDTPEKVFLNNCPKCNLLTRRPYSKQCRYCGHSWQGDIIEQHTLINPQVREHNFLECMYKAPYFPKFLVDKCRNILLQLCSDIETQKPDNLDDLYNLTHASTNLLNDLQEEFLENESGLETGARECLASDFEFIAKAYGFVADGEELIAPREW